ncbi:MAG TPA: hydrogenase maturation protease [Bryobacteraceae bacterium]|nr:hydrogenase maturation protease [Bryobacteraceae bacterium]
MTFLIAVGNTLRRDDGVAHRVLELLKPPAGVVVRSCHQLTPEMAEEIASADTVIIIDADVAPGEPRLEKVEERPDNPLTHVVRPAELVALSRRLFSFRGEAWLCRVPGIDFGQGSGLSPATEANACITAELLLRFLG